MMKQHSYQKISKLIKNNEKVVLHYVTLTSPLSFKRFMDTVWALLCVSLSLILLYSLAHLTATIAKTEKYVYVDHTKSLVTDRVTKTKQSNKISNISCTNPKT